MTVFHQLAFPLRKRFGIALALLLLLQSYLIYQSRLNDISNISCRFYDKSRINQIISTCIDPLSA
jgi:hypothetical protein